MMHDACMTGQQAGINSAKMKHRLTERERDLAVRERECVDGSFIDRFILQRLRTFGLPYTILPL
jgi:hypothetical protein